MFWIPDRQGTRIIGDGNDGGGVVASSAPLFSLGHFCGVLPPAVRLSTFQMSTVDTSEMTSQL